MSTLPTRFNGTGGLPGILRSTFAVSEKSADFEFDRSVGLGKDGIQEAMSFH